MENQSLVNLFIDIQPALTQPEPEKNNARMTPKVLQKTNHEIQPLIQLTNPMGLTIY